MGIYDEEIPPELEVVTPKKRKPTGGSKKKKTTTGTRSKPAKPKKVIANSRPPKKVVVEKPVEVVPVVVPVAEPVVVEQTLTPEEFFASIKPKPEYIKHLIECRCFLPQFSDMAQPPNHKFIVFSALDENGGVKQSYSQCNNCGVIHRVIEVGTSVTLKKESMMTLPTIDDIKTGLPDWLVGILEKNQCDELHTWQEAKFIIENELWGRFVVLAKERDGDMTNGKILQLLGNKLYKVEIFERDDGYATI